MRNQKVLVNFLLNRFVLQCLEFSFPYSAPSHAEKGDNGVLCTAVTRIQTQMTCGARNLHQIWPGRAKRKRATVGGTERSRQYETTYLSPFLWEIRRKKAAEQFCCRNNPLTPKVSESLDLFMTDAGRSCWGASRCCLQVGVVLQNLSVTGHAVTSTPSVPKPLTWTWNVRRSASGRYAARHAGIPTAPPSDQRCHSGHYIVSVCSRRPKKIELILILSLLHYNLIIMFVFVLF